jgi:hypothetical protein
VCAGVAHKRIPTGWNEWCREHVARSHQDIHKVMALASAADPHEAIAEERATRDAVARHRAVRTYISAQPDNDPPEPVTPDRPGGPRLPGKKNAC